MSITAQDIQDALKETVGAGEDRYAKMAGILNERSFVKYRKNNKERMALEEARGEEMHDLRETNKHLLAIVEAARPLSTVYTYLRERDPDISEDAYIFVSDAASGDDHEMENPDGAVTFEEFGNLSAAFEQFQRDAAK